MAETLIAVAVKVGTEVAFAVNAALPFGGAAATVISTAAGYATIAAVVVGTSLAVNAALAPSIPSPEAGKVSWRQTIPYRTRGVGTCRRSGPAMLYEATNNQFLQVLALNDGRVASFGRIWLNDDEVVTTGGSLLSEASGLPVAQVSQLSDGAYERVRLQARLGRATEAAFAHPASVLPGVWTADHRGDGIASLYCWAQNGKVADFPKHFPHGAPTPSIEVTHLVYDWRDEAQDRDDESTWQPSANAFVNFVHELWHVRGHDWDRRFAPVLADLTDEADYCDEGVATKAGGFVPRYALGGFYGRENPPADVYMKYLECMDGWWSQRGDGAFVIRAGRYVDPTVALTDDDIQSLSVQRWVEDEQTVNSIALSYTSPEHAYSQVDTDPWVDQDAIDEQGVERPTSMALTWVQNNNQARRLAKRKMARHGVQLRGRARCYLSGLKGLGERYLRLQSQRLPILNDLPIEILDAEIDIAGMVITYSWIAADPNIDAFNAATEEGDGPTDDERVAAEALVAPVIDSAVAFTASAGVGGDGVRIRITGTDPGLSDLEWFARWRVLGAASWKADAYTDLDSGVDAVLETDFVPADETVEVEVAYRTGGGILSDWSSPPEEVDTSTAGIAPGVPTGLVVTPGAGHADVAWINPNTPNFVGARVWRGTTTLGAATDVTGLRYGGLGAADSYDNTGVAAGSWKYWVTAENATGVKSSAGPVTVTIT